MALSTSTSSASSFENSSLAAPGVFSNLSASVWSGWVGLGLLLSIYPFTAS